VSWIMFTRSVISAGLQKRALLRQKGARQGREQADEGLDESY